MALVDLDDEACLDTGYVGGKAAALARARRSGAPVLPGFVVCAALGSALFAEALAEAEARGLPSGRYLLATARLPGELAAVLTARGTDLSASLVARSSSPLEGDPRWSGAFSSFLGVAPDELATAVASCWSSTLGPEVSERCEALSLPLADAFPSVLVQPLCTARFSGTARCEEGEVLVTAVEGAPAGLLSGWKSGVEAVVGGDGKATGEACDLLGGELLGAVAALARRVRDERDTATLIEWAHDGRKLVLFQVGRVAPSRRPRRSSPHRSSPLNDQRLVRLAAVVARYAGPLGEAEVLPWRIALTPDAGVDVAEPASAAEAVAALSRARRLAGDLTTAVFGGDPAGAATRAADALRTLALLPDGGGTLSGFDPADPAAADPRVGAEVLALFEALRRHLVGRGLMAAGTPLWAYRTEAVTASLARGVPLGPPARRPPALRFQQLLEAAASTGTELPARSGSPGRFAGLSRLLEHPGQIPELLPGEVAVLAAPLPGFAPALWRAGALVVVAPAEGAHLLEVARALRLPAVVGVGCALASELERSLLLVEGDAGRLWHRPSPEAAGS